MIFENIEIRELAPTDTNEVEIALKMMNRTQGDGLFTKKYLTDRISDHDAAVFVAAIEGELVGVGCAEIVKRFNYYLPFDENIIGKFENESVGSFCSLSVREDLQGKGIGQQISKKRFEWLKSKGCTVIVGVSWHSGLSHTSNRVFEKLGFRKVKTVEKFFEKDAIKNPFDCPGCKTQPCACSASLYIKNNF